MSASISLLLVVFPIQSLANLEQTLPLCNGSASGYGRAHGENDIPAFPLEHFFGMALGQCRGGIRPHKSDWNTPLRFYIYPLPGQFHRHILESLRAAVGSFECPPILWPCTLNKIPEVMGTTGHAALTFWQYMAEVVLLQKFLALGALHVSPEEADVFIVPALLATGSFVLRYVRGKWAYKAEGGTFSFADVLDNLPYYNKQTQRRHLFLRTSDCHWPEWTEMEMPLKGTPCDWMTPDFVVGSSLFVTLGAQNRSLSSHSGHLVVPPMIMEREHQPSAWKDEDPRAERAHLIFLQCSPGINPSRQRLVNSIQRYASDDSRILLLSMDADQRVPLLNQRETADRMRSSTFCPIPKGDLPYTTRYFLAVLSGCIPVVILYEGNSWFQPDGPRVEDTYPWATGHRKVDHRSMVVEIPEHRVDDLVPILLALPTHEIVKRRQAIFAQRETLAYDFSGSRPDAFSVLLKEIENRLKRVPAVHVDHSRLIDRASLSKQTYFPDVSAARSFFNSCCLPSSGPKGSSECFSETSRFSFEQTCVMRAGNRLDSLLPLVLAESLEVDLLGWGFILSPSLFEGDLFCHAQHVAVPEKMSEEELEIYLRDRDVIFDVTTDPKGRTIATNVQLSDEDQHDTSREDAGFDNVEDDQRAKAPPTARNGTQSTSSSVVRPDDLIGQKRLEGKIRSWKAKWGFIVNPSLFEGDLFCHVQHIQLSRFYSDDELKSMLSDRDVVFDVITDAKGRTIATNVQLRDDDQHDPSHEDVEFGSFEEDLSANVPQTPRKGPPSTSSSVVRPEDLIGEQLLEGKIRSWKAKWGFIVSPSLFEGDLFCHVQHIQLPRFYSDEELVTMLRDRDCVFDIASHKGRTIATNVQIEVPPDEDLLVDREADAHDELGSGDCTSDMYAYVPITNKEEWINSGLEVEGVLRSWRDTWGFIVAPSVFEGDVFCHAASFASAFCRPTAGMEVVFTIEEDKKGRPLAKNVRPAKRSHGELLPRRPSHSPPAKRQRV
eukprot:TRINITY_DN3441_c0_g1_i6.p1 TRINITY_DN3441_c0_g1~~TRINITY_DN3441_c0_g1_i6.p1  ORF type:complete len:1000 (+),score=106.69 TRINITY_DN3441_c0_g1_i6:50-3049(+)